MLTFENLIRYNYKDFSIISSDELDIFLKNNIHELSYKDLQQIFSRVLQYGTVLQVVTMLNNGMDANAPILYKLPIYFAIQRFYGDIDDTLKIIEILIYAGADVKSSIQSAVERDSISKISELIELLVKNGADVDVNFYSETYTSLVYAIFAQKYKTVEALIKNGADVNKKVALYDPIRTRYEHDREHYEDLSPLGVAIVNHQIEIMKLLLDNGADVNAEWFDKRKNKFSLLDLAAINNRKESWNEYLVKDNKEIIDLLVSRGAVSISFNPSSRGSSLKPKV